VVVAEGVQVHGFQSSATVPIWVPWGFRQTSASAITTPIDCAPTRFDSGIAGESNVRY